VASGTSRATFRDVFAVREFRALWSSQILSVIGDRLALVALTILVFDRSHSPLLTAVAYASGYVPWVIGALLLSGLADRFPRRNVMVVCDVIRAFLVALMTLPGVPLAVLVLLLFLTTMFAPPFESARAAITPDILEGERYVLGTTVVQTTFRTGLVVGAALGGITVAFIGPRPALVVDAATFVVSAIFVRFGTVRRPPAARGEGVNSSQPARLREGFRTVFGDPSLLTLVLLGWLVAFYAIPEGIAAPLAHDLGGGAAATGLILASGPFGGAVAAPVFSRMVSPDRRLRWMGPLAVGACAVLLLVMLHSGLAADIVIFAVSGALGAYQIAANTAFVERVPNARRSQAFGLANAGLIVGQGLMFMVAGAADETIGPTTVIAISGGVGAVAAVLLTLRWRRVFRRQHEPSQEVKP